jgi:hypothetical protein
MAETADAHARLGTASRPLPFVEPQGTKLSCDLMLLDLVGAGRDEVGQGDDRLLGPERAKLSPGAI